MVPSALYRLARRVFLKARVALFAWESKPGLPGTAWARCEPNPPRPDVLQAFRFFAVVGTWHEADIIAATVRNAFEQGCERVYLVDNDSPDDTVAVAETAGAKLVHSFKTDEYDETERMRLMNDVVTTVSASTAASDGDDHVWWLWLDADEFPHGPAGMTVREYLATLDRRFRVVGARYFNHYPDRVPEYLEGRHPLDHQPLCEEIVYPMCAEGHQKHPLQRWDASGPYITCSSGFHQAAIDHDMQLLEPAKPILLHHFPFRVEAVTRGRLKLLMGQDGGRASSDPDTHFFIHKRSRQLDAVYQHNWGAVETLEAGGRRKGVHLRPWTRQVPAADVDFVRF